MHLTVCDYIIEIVHNSIEAGAGTVEVNFDIVRGKSVSVAVVDDGCGMNQKQLKLIVDPFCTDGQKHVARKVGLGLSFLKQATDQCAGSLSVRSAEGVGTTVFFSFDLLNIDTPPVGDVVSSLASLMAFGTSNIVVNRTENGKEYSCSKIELKEALGELDSVGSKKLLKEFLLSQEEFIKNGG